MDPSDDASTLKMRGRCRTLGHHDRRNCATGAYQTYAEDAKVVAPLVCQWMRALIKDGPL